MFIVILFVIAKSEKQQIYPSVGEQMHKDGNPDNGILLSAKKKEMDY
jgi:hypothetical protein